MADTKLASAHELLKSAIDRHATRAPILEVLDDLVQAAVHGCALREVLLTTPAGEALAHATSGLGSAETFERELRDSTGSWLGLLNVTGHVSEEDRPLLDFCVSQITTVLADSADRRRQTLDLARQKALWSVVRASSQHLDLDDVLTAAVDALRAGIRCQGVMIRAFASSDPASLPHFSAAFPPEAETLMTGQILDISGRAARVCWDRQEVSSLHADERNPTPITNAAERDLMFDLMDFIGARGLLMAPIGGAGECQGYISLTRTTLDEPFDAADEAAVLAIGRELGTAVVHARLFYDQHRMVDELQELDRYKSQFIATVAHQLKNPLTSVTGHAELLADMITDPAADTADLTESVRVIQRGADRIRETADSLLTLSKLQDADHPFIPGLVAMTTLVAECLDMVSITARDQQVAIHLNTATRADASELYAWGDRGELEKLVDNLLGNAIKYSNPGGVVQLSLAQDGETLKLDCIDNGLGIAQVDLPRLFEPFHRSTDPLALAIPGTGLGMAITKRVVDRHGGRIQVTSTLGLGTRFTVTLPAAHNAG